MMVNSTFAKSSFFLPYHGNRKHITSHSTTKAHLHIHLKSLKPFDLLGFPLQQNDTLHMDRGGDSDTRKAQSDLGRTLVIPVKMETTSFQPHSTSTACF